MRFRLWQLGNQRAHRDRFQHGRNRGITGIRQNLDLEHAADIGIKHAVIDRYTCARGHIFGKRCRLDDRHTVMQGKHLRASAGAAKIHTHLVANRRHDATANCIGIKLVRHIHQKCNPLAASQITAGNRIAFPLCGIIKTLQNRIGRILGNRAARKCGLGNLFAILGAVIGSIPTLRIGWDQIRNIHLWTHRGRPGQVLPHHLQGKPHAATATRDGRNRYFLVIFIARTRNLLGLHLLKQHQGHRCDQQDSTKENRKNESVHSYSLAVNTLSFCATIATPVRNCCGNLEALDGKRPAAY